MSLCIRKLPSCFGFGKARRQWEEEARISARDKTIDSLYQVLSLVHIFPGVYLDDELARSFHISLEDLELNEDGNYSASNDQYFFKPWSFARLQAHPFDQNDEYSQLLLRNTYSWWERFKPSDERYILGAGMLGVPSALGSRAMCANRPWREQEDKSLATSQLEEQVRRSWLTLLLT